MIWTLCSGNLGLGFEFKLTDLDRIRILKSKTRTSLQASSLRIGLTLGPNVMISMLN